MMSFCVLPSGIKPIENWGIFSDRFFDYYNSIRAVFTYKRKAKRKTTSS